MLCSFNSCFNRNPSDDTRWQTVTRTNNGPLQDFTISYQNLLPSTSYTFRVISYNKYGISYPAYSDDVVSTHLVTIGENWGNGNIKMLFIFITDINSVQVVPGVRVSSAEAILSSDVVYGRFGCLFHHHHRNGHRCSLCEK